MKRQKRIIFIASSGGHLTQLLQLNPLFEEYNSFLITEKDKSTSDLEERFKDIKLYYLPETRKNNFIKYFLGNLYSLLLSIKYFIEIKPDFIISTGAGISVYIIYLAKIFGKKIIFIETYAALKGKSGAGKLIYPIANQFYVQWEFMKKLYPNAIFNGTLY